MSQCGCNKRLRKQYITTEGCVDPCEQLQSLVPEDPSEIPEKPIETVTLLDISSGLCDAITVSLPEQQSGCEALQEAAAGEATEKPLEELELLNVADGVCERVKIPVKTACEIMQEAGAGEAVEVPVDVPTLMNVANGVCVPVTLEPAKTICEEYDTLNDLGAIPLSEATFFGEWTDPDTGDVFCGKFKTECCSPVVYESVNSGGICLTVDPGQHVYNAYGEGGHASVDSIFNEIVYTNPQDYPVLLEVVWNFSNNRYPPSQYIKGQLISYLGPKAYAPTGTGNATTLGTTTFSGFEEDLKGVAYDIDEMVEGWVLNPDGYGPDTIFPNHLTQHPDRPGQSWPYPDYENPTHHKAGQLTTTYIVQPGETIEVIGTWVIRFNEDIVSPESFYLLGKMFATEYPMVQA